MNTLQFAMLFNVTETAIVLLLTGLVAYSVASRFFRFWTLGFAFGFGLTALELLTSFFGWSKPLLGIFFLGSIASSLCFMAAGFHLQERNLPRLIPVVWGGLAVLQMGLLVGTSLPFGALVVPAILLLATSFLWLGCSLGWLGITQRQPAVFWLAIPITLQGFWVTTYPMIVPSTLAWLGYLVIGGLQVFNGIGMMIYVLRVSLNEQRQLAFRLQEQNRRLEELDRLKNSFVGIVSHELRTPLTSIKGYAEFLEDDLGGVLSEEQRQYVSEILNGSTRLEGLVDDLLDFARLESGTLKLSPHEGDLIRTVNEVLNTMRPQAIAKTVTLSAPVLPESLVLTFDGRRIEQVLINLIGNALKFTPPGGSVTLRVIPGPTEVRIEVQDTGIGVEASKLPHLFDRFYQVDPSSTRKSGGVGLGLAIVKALVIAHGGQIAATSEPGRGSTFWFTLPRTPSPHDLALKADTTPLR